MSCLEGLSAFEAGHQRQVLRSSLGRGADGGHGDRLATQHAAHVPALPQGL